MNIPQCYLVYVPVYMNKLVESISSHSMFKCHGVNKLCVFNTKNLNAHMNIVTHSIFQYLLCSNHIKISLFWAHIVLFLPLVFTLVFFSVLNTLSHSCYVSKSYPSFEIHLKIYGSKTILASNLIQFSSFCSIILNCFHIILHM